MTLNKAQIEILSNLVKAEMDCIFGDLGYEELSKIKHILDQELTTTTYDDS